jgi:hypothetical protein
VGFLDRNQLIVQLLPLLELKVAVFSQTDFLHLGVGDREVEDDDLGTVRGYEQL